MLFLTNLALSITIISWIKKSLVNRTGVIIIKVLTLLIIIINLSLKQNKEIANKRGAWEGATIKCLRLKLWVNINLYTEILLN